MGAGGCTSFDRMRTQVLAVAVLVGSVVSFGSAAAAVAPTPPLDGGQHTDVFTNSTAQSISAFVNPPIVSTVAVSGVGKHLADLDVTTFLRHDFSADLDVTLQSPSGTIVTLTTDNGGANHNVFNGTVWDDHADPAGQLPFAGNSNIVTRHTFTDNVVASPLTPEEPLAAFDGEDPNGTWTLTVIDDSDGDGGSLDSWSLSVTSQRLAPDRVSSSASMTTAVNIPDTGSVASAVVVSGAAAYLCKVAVTTTLAHPASNQLDVTLQSPAGTVVTLTSGNGSTNSFNGTVWDDDADPSGAIPYVSNVDDHIVTDASYTPGVVRTPLTPQEALGAFIGEDPNGSWTLTVNDNVVGQVGVLNGWSLDITSCPFADALHGLTPGRLLDTRADGQTADGQYQRGGALGAGSTLVLPVAGRGGVPLAGAGAVALNITATEPTAATFITVFPTGSTLPTASNLNAVAGQTVPNMVIVPVGSSGQVSLYNNAGSVQLVVDVLGWFPAGESIHGLAPARLLDTRPGQATVDGQFKGGGAVGALGTLDLTVAGRGGVPANGVGSVALNVTATSPTSASFATVFPTGSTRPTASNLNVVTGQTVANMVIVPLGAGGKVTLYNNAGSTHFVVDVLGWFPSGEVFTGSTPARLLETRPGLTTIDGQYQTGALQGPGSSLVLRVTGRGGVPSSGAGSVALNVTVTSPTIASFVTVFPTGAPRPTASNLNFVTGQTVANMVIVPIGTDGNVTLYNNAGSTHLVVDVLGWFPALT